MEADIKLTVFFEGMFWVGVFEKTTETSYEVSRVVFGAEPKDYEIFEFINRHFYKINFKNSLITDTCTNVKDKKINPKRVQRELRKETENKGIGTKAQQALQLQYEENKLQRKKLSKERREAEAERKFQLKQEKKLKKHKGH